MNLKIFKFTFFGIILAEFFSFFGYFYPIVNRAAFFVIVIAALVVSLYKLEYGLLIMLAELIIGSKGYLFYFDFGGFSISIRVALFIVVVAVWAGKIINGWIKNKKLEIGFLKSPYAKYFIILFVFIAWGVINGILQGNSFNNLFFDFNGWLYFLLVFPVYEVIYGAQNVETHRDASPKEPPQPLPQQVRDKLFTRRAFALIAAAIVWLSVKTLLLLFIFSHSSMDVAYEIYRWVRTSGVGEITNIQGGFYRIFFQSHIFTLIGFFTLLALLARREQEGNFAKKETKLPIGNLVSDTGSGLFKENKKSYLLFPVSCFLFSTIIISFSRSFWAGLVFGIVTYFLILLFKKEKKIWRAAAIIFSSLAVSLLFIALIVKFPYPGPIDGFNTADLLLERVSNLNESAVASRWDLLPSLWQEIKSAPILGKGFGATASYKSSDPRILEQNPSGEYTTYAFEWGWLDIWLKLGIGGIIAYLFLIGKIIYDGLSKISNFEFRISNVELISGLIMGIAVISVVNIFSPYLNHPLGIGYLILVSAILNKKGVLKLTPGTE